MPRPGGRGVTHRRSPRPGSAAPAAPRRPVRVGHQDHRGRPVVDAARRCRPSRSPSSAAEKTGRIRASRSAGHPGPGSLVGAARPPTGTSSASKPPASRVPPPGCGTERVGVLALPARRRPCSATRSAAAPISGRPSSRGERRPLVADRGVPGQYRSGAVEADSTPPASSTRRRRAQQPGRRPRPRPTRCRTAGPRSAPVRRPAARPVSAATRATSPPGPVQLPSTTSATPARPAARRPAPAARRRPGPPP